MPKRKIIATAAGVAGAVALAGFAAPTAAADPPGIPFVPGVPAPLPATPGSYTYIYNNFPAVAPAAVDARGVKIAANADPMAAATGLPGSKLGNSAHPANVLTSSSTRYGIQGGATPAAPGSTTGVQFGAGNENPALEDPHGQAPESAPAIEPTSPTVTPGAPAAPVLESPDGQPPKPAEAAAG
ncbi:hypothetical protein [Mycobacteroides saopaulense]|uniref:MPT63-like domain-containing protein n=1 Tax=Mycobacteroides saopaulense TaxID=1578165 RepID=A0A1X0JFI9_9MYCO|nr:hypothetical protein [Mycobacteroides saopaulense]OHT88209.1 hypothetical protein BKG68_06320 [Mycobacteroides saopaulense]OHU06549.1 hypothetical protein BKG73_20465 [Mycobacteroides saopaulense]ORB61017.1 hypothetical protein BST43_01300 [Mycobacteroides saopaulense]